MPHVHSTYRFQLSPWYIYAHVSQVYPVFLVLSQEIPTHPQLHFYFYSSSFLLMFLPSLLLSNSHCPVCTFHASLPLLLNIPLFQPPPKNMTSSFKVHFFQLTSHWLLLDRVVPSELGTYTIRNWQWPLNSHFALKMERVRIFETLAIQPISTQCHHPEKGPTLVFNCHENRKSSNPILQCV